MNMMRVRGRGGLDGVGCTGFVSDMVKKSTELRDDEIFMVAAHQNMI